MEQTLSYTYLSVDCVVFGFDGERLTVLLVRRTGEEDGKVFHDLKLPGSIIYEDEDLDEAAERVLMELCGLRKTGLMQFRAYGSKDRTKNPKDVRWLERAQHVHAERIVTVAYMTFQRISRLRVAQPRLETVWMPVDQVPDLAFDHNTILRDAVRSLPEFVAREPSVLFHLLPQHFTVTQLRNVYNAVTGERIDAQNFYKKLKVMPYVVLSPFLQKGVAHRAARYYRFDAKTYKKYRI